MKTVGNYFGMHAVISGLQNAAVARLKHSWSLVPKKSHAQCDEMSNIVDSSKAYRSLRLALISTPVSIPPTHHLLTDLAFIEEGNARFVDTNINLRKMQLLHSVIECVTQVRHIKLPFARNDAVIRVLLYHIQKHQSVNMTTMFEKSLVLEPRNTTFEQIP